jgi:hypothetical protein
MAIVVLCVKKLGMLPFSRQTNKRNFTPCFRKCAAIYANFGASANDVLGSMAYIYSIIYWDTGVYCNFFIYITTIRLNGRGKLE